MNGNSNNVSKILTPSSANNFLNNQQQQQQQQQITVVLAQPSSILQNPTEALQAAKRAYPQPQQTTNLDIKKVKLVEHQQQNNNSQNTTPAAAAAAVKKEDSAVASVGDALTGIRSSEGVPTLMSAKSVTENNIHQQMKVFERSNNVVHQKGIDTTSTNSMKQLNTNLQPVMNVSITNAES